MRIHSLPRYCFKQEGDDVIAATSPCTVLPPVDCNRKFNLLFLFSWEVILVIEEINGSQGEK